MNRQTIAKISAVVITVALVAMLLSQIEVSDVITTLAGIDPLYLIAGFVLYVCSYFFSMFPFKYFPTEDRRREMRENV